MFLLWLIFISPVSSFSLSCILFLISPSVIFRNVSLNIYIYVTYVAGTGYLLVGHSRLDVFVTFNFSIPLIFLLDLNNDEFSAGRGELNDLILTLNDLPEKILSRISKVHFIIKRANCELTNPVYIQVGSSKYAPKNVNYNKSDSICNNPPGSLTQWDFCEWRTDRHEQNAHPTK